ncbi:DUF397 domain-containing protein [Streptomyces sp. DSM 44915]|uniref:DUF397 domain-containing protein n=1 Tax=Streptomyces chisholmiae TaxID=3075540 RepID=A0ABU2K051_9ACTN|nr:DUF397 domain-containing protein [Streptomyces sp. DSM 44915]MDT0270630.1 DUF397 domain-containing protein [Streptomyces sp. DSM 44915]
MSKQHWRKSSHSSGNGGACLEVRDGVPGAVPVRDSKVRTDVLTFGADAWGAFVRHVGRR